MTVAELLQALRRHGAQIAVQDGALRLKTTAELPAVLRDTLAAQRDALVALLRDAPAASAQRPIPPAPPATPLPLSFAQQRLWFLHQWQGNSPLYNEAVALRLEGVLDLPALEEALREVVRRHAVFRTSFEAAGDVPQQRIAPTATLALRVQDLSAAATEEAIAEEAARPFDLGRDLMLRATLFRQDAETGVLVLVMHHIACDGWSSAVLVREWTTLYAAFRQGEPSPLPPLPIQYADFAAWQRDPARRPLLDRDLAWWKQHLSGAPGTIPLPTDRPRPARETFSGARHDFMLDATTTTALRQLGRDCKATPFMVLSAGFNLLLQRYSGQDDLVVGTPIANRDRQELEGLAGFFVNTLALRSDLSGDPSLRALLDRVRRVAQDAFAHQALPFEQLVEALAPRRSLSHAPLFQVMFSLRNAPQAPLALPGLRVTPLPLPCRTAKFDLLLFLHEQDGGLAGSFEYNTDLFDAATVARMAGHLCHLLATASARPDVPLSTLPMLPDAERDAALAAGRGARTDYPRNEALTALWARQLRRTPDAPAIRAPDACLSYAGLDNMARGIAAQLVRHGARPGEFTGIALGRSAALVGGILGILMAGGAYVPLDPAYPRERLAFMLADAGIRHVVTDRAHAAALAGLPVTLLLLDEAEKAAPPLSLPPPAGPLDPACVMYTSGSTGRPKGVVVPHRAVARLVCGTDYLDFPAIRRMAHLSNTAFDAATFEIWGALLHGAELVVVPQDTLLAPDAFTAALRRDGIDTLFLTAALFHRMAAERPDAFGGVAQMLVGGEPVSPAAIRRVMESGAPPRRISNAYGPTEATTFAVSGPFSLPASEGQAVPIGRPLANTEAHVLDPAGQPLPPGIWGELWIGGNALALGYLNRPELTAERFVDTPLGRLYRSGDRARRRPDGQVELSGRLDRQIKLRGYRIEPGEVEAALACHPGVRDALVAVHDAGKADARLVAYVLPDHPGHDGAGAEHVQQWETLFDATYREDTSTRTASPLAPADPALNFRGWESSYTGAPIPADEMREWLDHTLAEIEALAPARVLEIGCGTGLLLARLAPAREAYVGTDFSQAALDGIAALRRARPELAHVHLARQMADDLAGLPEGGFDLVVINSVAQYFPSLDYLLQVLRAAATRLRPGGRIYLGDLRNADLDLAFHASVQAARAEPGTTLAELGRQVRDALADEEELLVAPALLHDIGRHVPGLGCERVSLKRGRFHNELTRFRYQAVLRRDMPPPLPAVAHAVEWAADRPGLPAVRAMLAARPAALVLRGIANARLGREAAL
ncbi:non-ribosomal peptide synthetase, partial [Teichococcus wenyumeiae]